MTPNEAQAGMDMWYAVMISIIIGLLFFTAAECYEINKNTEKIIELLEKAK